MFIKSFAIVVAAVLAVPGAAATVVSATTDIFLASQPNGTVVTGYFGSDRAPAASPVAFTTSGGATLTFAASGSTSVDGSCFAGPDGGCYADESSFSPAPASNAYKGPASALLGVFAGPTAVDVQSSVATIDYSVAANRSLATYTPGIGQIFFIGDGLTDSGVVQQFVAPVGATRLYLAVADSIGASTGNPGSLAVDVTGATPLAGAVPEPASWALLVAGFAAIGVAIRRRRETVVAA